MIVTVDLKGVERFFFKAMVQGWADDGAEKEDPAMLGYKTFTYKDGSDFCLVDRWCTRMLGSAGTTTIWHQGFPIWVMHYGGWYTREAVKCVKAALHKAYRARQFFGGRGPCVFIGSPPLWYVNTPHYNSFSHFSGREQVFDPKGITSLGWHEYLGMSLTDLPVN